MELVYRGFRSDLASGKVNWATGQFKVALLRPDYVPSVLHTLWSEVSPYEISSATGSYERITNTTGKILDGCVIIENADGTVYCAANNPAWDSTTISSAAMAVIVRWDSASGPSGAYRLVSCYKWQTSVNGAVTQGTGIKFYPVTGYTFSGPNGGGAVLVL